MIEYNLLGLTVFDTGGNELKFYYFKIQDVNYFFKVRSRLMHYYRGVSIYG